MLAETQACKAGKKPIGHTTVTPEATPAGSDGNTSCVKSTDCKGELADPLPEQRPELVPFNNSQTFRSQGPFTHLNC